MDLGAPELPVDPLDLLRKRRSAKWQTYPADVLPLTVAEMDFALAAPVAEALHEAVERSDAGYAMAVPGRAERWRTLPPAGGAGTSTRCR
jgi:cystathionine beta-lyase